MRFHAFNALLFLSLAIACGPGPGEPAATSRTAEFAIAAPVQVLTTAPLMPEARPGQSFSLTYRWSGGPTSSPQTVFVHFLDANDVVRFQDDHVPPTPTSQWTGSVSYTRTVTVPAALPAGTYRIVVGLYAGSSRLELQPGTNVLALTYFRYKVGTLTVNPVVNRPLRRVTTYGARCNGLNDDTLAIQSALDAVQSGEAVEFPAGTCVVSNVLRLGGKSNVVVYGAGREKSVIRAIDPNKSSFIITDGYQVVVQELQIHSPNATSRGWSGAADRGFYVERGDRIQLSGVKVRNVQGAGILLYSVTNSVVEGSEVIHSWADAFHVTGASAHVTFQNNFTDQAGDDCFASIGYGLSVNSDISILDNVCDLGNASGVSFEGTLGGRALRNLLQRTAVAGIRVAANASWSTGTVSDVQVRENTLVGVRTNTSVDHAAVMVFADRDEVKNVTLADNVIQNPNTWSAIRALGLNGSVVHDCAITGNRVTDSLGKITRCLSIEAGTVRITTSANTLNGGSCN
jgi:hypothetical protein